MSILLEFIKPLLTELSDSNETELYQFEYEQQYVAKLIFILHNSDPYKQVEMMNLLKNVFLKGGEKRQKFTLGSLVNAYLLLAYHISRGYDAILNGALQQISPSTTNLSKNMNVLLKAKETTLN